MASESAGVRKALKTLQGRLRQHATDGEPIARTFRAHRDGEDLLIRLTLGEQEAMTAAESAVAADLRFEHLTPASNEIDTFATDCAVDKTTNHVDLFMARYGKEPVERVCYHAVEVLGTAEPAEFLGIRLLPLDDPEIPPMPHALDPATRSVAAVAVIGTNTVSMEARARKQVGHALAAAAAVVAITIPFNSTLRNAGRYA